METERGKGTEKAMETERDKSNMRSAIPVALLCMTVNLSEVKQGSHPKRDKVL